MNLRATAGAFARVRKEAASILVSHSRGRRSPSDALTTPRLAAKTTAVRRTGLMELPSEKAVIQSNSCGVV